MDRNTAVTGAVVVLAAFGCAWLLVRTTQPIVHTAADGGDPLAATDPPALPLGAKSEALAPARCVELVPAVPLDMVAPGAPSSIDWGDGIFDARGLVAAGVVRPKPGERAAAIVSLTVGEGAPKPAVVDLGRASGDDPAPRPFVLGDALYAARVETAHDKRRLVVTRVGGVDASGALSPAPKEATSFAQSSDESLAYDIAPTGDHAFVAWDDDELGRGVIRLARFAETATEGVVISPKTTDAEAPRLVDDGTGGAWVAWIARKPENVDASVAEVAAHFVETPAEGREERWVEIAHVDPSGAARAAALRLAPGRVSDFDLRHEPAAPGGAAVAVVMRDEAGAVEARGARLVRQIVSRGDGDALSAAAPAVVVGEGVGSADPIFVDDGASGFVAYADLAERLRLAPLAPATADAGAPSLEVGLEGGRVLASRPLASLAKSAALAARIKRAEPRGAAVFAVGSKQDRAEARILLCER